MRFSVRMCACLMVCKHGALKASADDRRCRVDFTDGVELQKEGGDLLGVVWRCHRVELRMRCAP